MLNVRWCRVFFYFHKDYWDMLWDAVKVLGKSLILLGLHLRVIRWEQNSARLRANYSPLLKQNNFECSIVSCKLCFFFFFSGPTVVIGPISRSVWVSVTAYSLWSFQIVLFWLQVVFSYACANSYLLNTWSSAALWSSLSPGGYLVLHTWAVLVSPLSSQRAEHQVVLGLLIPPQWPTGCLKAVLEPSLASPCLFSISQGSLFVISSCPVF